MIVLQKNGCTKITQKDTNVIIKLRVFFPGLQLFSDTITPVLDLTKVINEGLKFRLKSYTNNNITCKIETVSLHPNSLELICELSGSAPDFNLTVGFGDKQLRITEGNWTLKITHEQVNASITFMLVNKTVEGES